MKGRRKRVCSGGKMILLISGKKNLGPDAKVDATPAYLPSAPGTVQSVTCVSSKQGKEQSLKTMFLRPNPESQNRWQFSEE